MRRKIKSVFIVLSIAIVIIAGASIFLLQKMRSTFNDQKVIDELLTQNVIPKTEFVSFGNYSIHTKYIGDLSLPKVLFIHGSPGYWFDFKKVFADVDLSKQFSLISFDRPGYGKTSVPAMGSLSNQARVAAKVLEHYLQKDKKSIVLGHSFGGAVLEQLLIDYSDNIKHAIYVAPCLSPEYQEAKWYNILATGGIPQRILPHELKNSNKEMLDLSECLIKNESRISAIDIPTTYIQGKKDILVPFKTLHYYQKYHSNINSILLEDLDHFVPWSRPDLIVETIKNVNQQTN
ncbi:alpha/beta fold hydrolase [Marinifilum sp. D737]|uniref:alpha/beta fold hydrolase n=1 Tax=Marinifilum sp. D737 TaxID=2969628 RepID=UPI002276DCB2|nr:alpha/beta hydrolase [Marinifilum sp. D737]MCY1636519.1 alpha/beta hydrolase [Marinifilum sp. D737]